ncbi:MAG: UvrD-helicase domain-containing protein [Candidatus Poseidoniaceae archaeon]|nr:UvrD-helicase domain-containing protein [Candidatus Poseidoniaceae archaeon]
MSKIKFNLSQKLGLDLDKHIALDAGAGTGKTTVMAERYVQHLITSEQRATLCLPNGPREPLQGQGSLRAPAKERKDFKEWKGLTPGEVVAITFTKKAAAELKARIRKRVSILRPLPIIPRRNDLIFDSRIKSDADVEKLVAALDDAPISTIDAFLSGIVSPHLDMVAIHPSRQQIAEERTPLLQQETLHTAWRIRSEYDAQEAGIYVDKLGFIEARDRLAILLGGQAKAAVVFKGMLWKSLFVEESRRSISRRCNDMGLVWDGVSDPPSEVLLQMMVEPVQHEVLDFATKLKEHLLNWTNIFTQYSANYVTAAEVLQGTNQTRFNHLLQLARDPLPVDATNQLQWVWLVAIATASWKPLHEKDEVKFFSRGNLPSGNKPREWPSGLLPKSKITGVSGAEKTRIANEAKPLVEQMVSLLDGQQGRLIRMLGMSSFSLEPYSTIPMMAADCKYRISPLMQPIPERAPAGILRISSELQSSVLADLLTVHRGCKAIMTLRKAQEGVHDFDDMQILAGDLLLSRCPESCRFDYPVAVVEALDSLADEPWTDHHISRAFTAAHGNEKCLQDLDRRFKVLLSLRRKYRAFIIDEYQDTNPAHFRLLARLWGPRDRRSGDPSSPLGEWDPTICIVGDMKQSIYRFRQAEVTVMLRAVAEIRKNNQIELSDTTLAPYRKAGCGRDPRPTGGGDSFSNEHKTGKTGPQPWTHIPAEIEDDEFTPILLKSRIQQRQEGHIDLTSNHRTLHNLMYTMNGIFDDVFNERHHALPGDWHAKAQPLNPARDDDANGILEWLLPLQIEAPTPEQDLLKPLVAFDNPKAQSSELEHELIALRLHALFNNSPTKIWNGATNAMVEIVETDDKIVPDDVIILLHSRTHLPDLINKLQAKGIPVLADRQGALLSRPVCITLMAVLELMSNPYSKHAALAICRSPIMGLKDAQIAKALATSNKDGWWSKLIENSPSDAVKNLLIHVVQLVKSGAVYDVFDAILDHSDLLIAYPEDSDRQNGEAWYGLANKIGNELGHDCNAIYNRMKQLEELGKTGPKAVSVPSGGAVQVMTIHGVKGLQSKVVVVAGLFKAGKMDATMAVKENVLITPQVIAGRINPWTSRERPLDGLWQFTKNMDSAQTQAERRREFYVAMTRVKDRLILVGSPSQEAVIGEGDGCLTLKSKPNKRCMGLMLLEGLRGFAHNNLMVDSPWLLEKDDFNEPLMPYGEAELKLDPGQLYSDSGFGGNSISGIRVYHSPICFDFVKTKSPLSNWLEVETRVNKMLKVNTPSKTITKLPMVSQAIRMSSHSLDTSHQCRRRHWLEHVKGWKPEKLSLLIEQDHSAQTTTDNWPSATKFGLIMHRLVEIGLANPAAITGEPCLKLPEGWRQPNLDELANDSVIKQVLAEFNIGISSGDKNDAEQAKITAQRLAQLSKLTQNGLLGKLSAGKTQNGFTVEGLRTELPFLYKHNIAMQDKLKTVFSLSGPQPVANVEQVTISFDGRADLVLALRDQSNKGFLQIVDLKTTGCRSEFNETNANKGHLLQRLEGDPLSPFATTAAEKKILAKYRLQLTLYSLALEAMESAKPLSEQREVLAPALLIGASGRMVRLTDDEYQQSRQDLENHLQWMAQLSITNDGLDEPSRLAQDEISICKQCPYHNGQIRLCGPIDTYTGHINNNQ